MKALSVRQPWAWLLFNGKPVENRDWYTHHRDLLAIHAAKGMLKREYEDAVDFVRHFDPQLAAKIPSRHALVMGAVIGTVNQTGCVRQHPSPFFQGLWGHVYENPTPFDAPIPCVGSLGLWDWQRPREEPRGKSLVGMTIPERLF